MDPPLLLSLFLQAGGSGQRLFTPSVEIIFGFSKCSGAGSVKSR